MAHAGHQDTSESWTHTVLVRWERPFSVRLGKGTINCTGNVPAFPHMVLPRPPPPASQTGNEAQRAQPDGARGAEVWPVDLDGAFFLQLLLQGASSPH